MGSGSSKAAPPKNKTSAPPKPVANVNKQEPKDLKENNNTLPRHVPVRSSNIEHNLHLSGPIAPIETNKSDAKRLEIERENERKSKNTKPTPKPNANGHAQQNPTSLQFEDDSDVDDDIDAVLKIPMAMEPLRSNRKDKKGKKDRENDKENIDNRDMYDYRGDLNDHSGGFSQRGNSDSLPETYAQRLQRQQYKLQQDMLIREKTSIKNLRDWQYDDEDDKEDYSPKTGGFDASKFRAANRGGDGKADFFSTVKDDLQTPRYLQSSGQELDEVDVHRRETESPGRRLPQYNQSELDLMRRLEADIL